MCRNRNLEEFGGRTVGSPCLELSMTLASIAKTVPKFKRYSQHIAK